MLILVTLNVLFCSFIFAVQGKAQSFFRFLITIVLYACTQIIITEMFLGVVLQKLTSFTLLAVNGLVLLAAILLFYRRTTEKRFLGLIKNVITEIRGTKISFFTWALIGLAIFVSGYVIYLGYLFPPYAYDSLTYHLPPVASWIQNGKISIVTGVDGFSNYYPKNAELFYLWNLILSKNDMWVDLIQFVFWGIGCLTVIAISRNILKMDIQSSVLAGIFFFFTPIGLMQSKTCYVDVIFTVFVLISIFFVLDYLLNKNNGSIGLASLAMAIFLGIKPQSLIYIFILYTLLLYKTINEHRFNRSRIILIFMGILLLFISISGYWYIRNYVVFHNPLYPFRIQIRGIINLPGYMSLKSFNHNDIASRGSSSQIMVLLKNWLEIKGYYQYDSPNGGLGILWITMMVPSIIWKTTAAWKNKDKAYIYLCLIIVICFILQPLNWLTRYVIYIVALGSISLVWCLNSVKFKKLSSSLVFILVVFQVVLLSHQTFFSLDKVVLFQNIKPENRSAALFTGSKSMILLDILSVKGDIVYFQDIYPNFTYPLWGNHLERRVYPIGKDIPSVNKSAKANIFYLIGPQSEILPKLLNDEEYLLLSKDQKNYYLFVHNDKEIIDKINHNLNKHLSENY